MNKILLIVSLLLCSKIFASSNPKIEIQGHRGARSVRPENTLAGFKYTLENKIEVLEMDLSYTADRVLVVNHDAVINGTICLDPNGQKIVKDLDIHKMTVAEIQKYDCGTLINPRFPRQTPSPKEKIPTFEDVLKLVKEHEKTQGMSFGLNVEIKVHNKFITDNSQEIIKKIISLVKKYDLYERTVIQSFDINIIDQVRKLDSKIKTSFLIEQDFKSVLKALKVSSLGELAKKYKFNILSPNHKLLSKAIVKELQAQGLQVIPWTANNVKEWQALLDMEVDGIITDDPVALREFLNKKTTP